MIDLVLKTIGILKAKINTNLTEVQSNELIFKQIVIRNNTENKEQLLHNILETNKSLLAENFDILNVQIYLVKFLEKYKYQVRNNKSSSSNPEFSKEEISKDYLKYTIAGKLPFNSMHPMFNDNAFFFSLVKYYQDKEEYEKCAELLKTRLNEKHS